MGPRHRLSARGRRPGEPRGLLALVLAGLVASGCSLVSGAGSLAELAPRTSEGRRSGGAARDGAPARSADAGSARRGDAAAAGDASAARRPFTLDLAEPRDHVAQFDGSWCVGASMQMMINIIDPGRADRTRETQQQLYRFARKVSPWIETRPGASVYGWAEGLEALGYGPYDELAADSRQDALQLAARQMRLTGKPVGLLVWAGAHAWVMSGFRATADPAVTDDFQVTHVWIEDPWAGRVSRTWGAGLDPHTLLTVRELASDYVRYASVYRPQYGRAGKYVVVAPTG